MTRFPVHLPKLDRILSGESALQPLLAKAREIRALAGLVDRFLAAELSSQVRVVNFRDGEVVLVAGNSAAAAKLRLLAPSLNRFLCNQRWQVSSVSVRVQPNASHTQAAAAQKAAQFSTHTLDSLMRLHAAMRPSPARTALEALLRRRGAIACEKVPLPRTGSARTPGRKRRT